MSQYITDVVVDTLYEEVLERFASSRDGVKIVRDPADEEKLDPYFTPEDFMVVRIQPGANVNAIVDDLQRQHRTTMRVVAVVERKD